MLLAAGDMLMGCQDACSELLTCYRMASNELAAKLQRRTDVIESAEDGKELPEAHQPSMQIFNPYTEFKEFSRKQIQHYQKMFNL
jgi:hypothetical protein